MTGDRIGIATAARRIGLPTTNLRRYTDVPEIAEWLGMRGDPPTLAEESLPLLQQIAERKDDPRYKPKAIVKALEEGLDLRAILLGDEEPGDRTPETGDTKDAGGKLEKIKDAPNLPAVIGEEALVHVAKSFAGSLVPAVVEALKSGPSVLSAILPVLPPAPEDELITAEDASKLLHCEQRSVGRYVPRFPGRRGLYRKSDVLRYIQTGTPIRSPKSGYAKPETGDR